MNIYDARNLLLEQMRKHGLTQRGWYGELDNAKRRFGQCRHGENVISLSSHLARLNSREQVLDTILHEIAHALVGPGHGHDAIWRRKCIEIGANPSRCYDANEVVKPPAKYVGTCPSCEWSMERHRLTQKAREGACPRCCNRYNGGTFTPKFKLIWRQRVRVGR